MKRFFGVFLLFFFWSSAQYKIKQYNTLNSNLPHDLCYGLEQDHNGFIWIGTDDGLARFNGSYFKNYTSKDGLFSNYVIDITTYAKDTLALVTWGGGMQLLAEDRFINIGEKLKLNKIKKFNQGLFTKGVYYVFYQNNDAKRKEFIFLNNQSIVIEPKKQNPDVINCYPNFEVVHDQLYFFSDFNEVKPFKGIYKFEEEALKKEFLFLNDYEITGFGAIDATSYFATFQHKMVFFTDKGIKRIESIPYQNCRIKKAIYKEDVLVMILYNLITKKEELFIYDLKLKKQQLIPSTIIENQLISDVLLDVEGNIWVSTYGAGLFKIFKEDVYIANHNITSENIIDVFEGHKKVYFIAAHKLFQIDKTTQNIDSITVDEELWRFGTNSNENKKIRIFKRSSSNDSHEVKIFDNICITNQKPDSVANEAIRTTFIEYDITIESKGKKKKYLLKNKIRKVLLKNDKVYIATTNGLLIYDVNTNAFKLLLGTNKDYANNDIKDIAFIDDTLWMATSKGLLTLENNKIINYSKGNELLEAGLNSLCVDHHNVIWLATQKGFSIFKDNTFYNFFYKDKEVSTFTQKVYEDTNNTIWIIGNKGVLKVNNQNEFQSREKPKINVTQKGLIFNVDIISFSKIEVIKEYKVNQENWQKLTEAELDFKNFQYGKYTLQFRSKLLNSDWVYSKKYTLNIKAPWYKQSWSLLLIVFLSGVIVIGVIYIRLKHVQKRNQFLQATILKNEILQTELSSVRENVAQDFHDELGNKLAGITVLSGMIIEDEKFKKTDWFKQLERINKDAQELYFGIKDFIWSIDSKNDDLNELIFYLKDFGEELFASTKIEFNIEINIDNTTIKLPYYWSRQLLLLFKEAMTNTLKYSEATHCVLKIKTKKNKLKIIFSDNGKGFDSATLKRKNGLLNMHKRANKIDGNLTIEAINGTEITFISKPIF